MFDRILKRMVAKIRTREYIMTVHAEEEMNADGLTIFDVERGILTGAIIGRQREEETKEWKYLLHGETVAGDGVTVVAKMSPTGKLVIITVFLE